MEVIHLPELDEMGDRFSEMPKTPLKITLRTLQPIVATEPIHLDGLLAKAAVMEAMRGKPLPLIADAYWIPLPLKIERICDGLPLWKSTDFRSENSSADHTHYHQRSDSNPYDLPATYVTLGNKKPRRMPPTTEGQYMSYRVPIQRTIADAWQATCVGNKDEVLRLLGWLQYVGKKSSQGYGRISSWDAEEIDDFKLCDRPVPVSTPEDFLQYGSMRLAGWTPPYWHRGLWQMCVFPN